MNGKNPTNSDREKEKQSRTREREESVHYLDIAGCNLYKHLIHYA